MSLSTALNIMGWVGLGMLTALVVGGVAMLFYFVRRGGLLR